MNCTPPDNLKQIAERFNTTAGGYRMAGFQGIRARLKGYRRAARDIFVPRAGKFNPTWAYHYGGRTELQFDIGLEERERAVCSALKTGEAFPDADTSRV